MMLQGFPVPHMSGPFPGAAPVLYAPPPPLALVPRVPAGVPMSLFASSAMASYDDLSREKRGTYSRAPGAEPAATRVATPAA